MSTATKKTTMKGVRYTDAQKKEVVDFAVSYNAENGRGGQSKAVEKYNISNLTVATWLKNSGVAKAPKREKVTKAPKTTKTGPTDKRSRYSDEQKKELTDFVVSYNAENGRGGPSKATKKFGVSPLTVIAWLKAAGVHGAANKKTAKGSKSPSSATAPKSVSSTGIGGLSAKLNSLLALSSQIDRAEAELAQLKDKFSSLKAAL